MNRFAKHLRLLAAVLLFSLTLSACRAERKDQPASEATAGAETTSAPLSPLDVQNAVYGFVLDEEPRDAAQLELCAHLLQDLRWNLRPGEADRDNMAFIPAGRVKLGCPLAAKGGNQCLPIEERELPAFYLDRRETTNAEYRECVAANQCVRVYFMDFMPDHLAPDRPALLTPKQAERYCLWRGKRLSTEAEWEKAARGSDGRLYPWGDAPPTPELVNICGRRCPMPFADPAWDDGFAFTNPVDDFAAGDSPFGLRNMSGNVKEWTIADTPLPPDHFVARGASWYSTLDETRAHYRQVWRPGVRLDDKGVRCAADAEPATER